MPLRRNSGPESEFAKMSGKKKSKSSRTDESNYSKRKSAEFLNQNSSSSESLENLISSKGKKGLSLERNIESFDVDSKSKPKRSSWFLRDRSREKQQKFFKRSSLDFTTTSSTSFDAKLSRKSRIFHRQNATEYTGDSSTTQNDEFIDSKSTAGLSKFQLGKRLLKGEIGIRSFNYYLLKEGMKKRGTSKQDSTPPKSRSEENIYEEIYFRHDLPTPKPRTPPELPPMNKVVSKPLQEDCANCEICLQEAAHNLTVDREHLMMSSDGYTRVDLRNSQEDYFQHQPMLQFQSYNPSIPNVYKIESTPLVSIDYQPTSEEKTKMQNDYQSFRSKTSIVTKSIRTTTNEFYTRPNYIYPPSTTLSNVNVKPSRVNLDVDDKICSEKIFKVNSSTSVRSGGENETIYNGSQKSNHSNKSSDAHHQMSDSSIGDSLFSSDPNKRGFGSSESCRFNYERRRRNSLEKCSFSDTCNTKNCDCSSSYFSSDFDDNNIYNHINSNPEDYYEHQRTNLCVEEMKKVSKKRAQNHHYEVPKRMDVDKKVSNKSKSAVSSDPMKKNNLATEKIAATKTSPKATKKDEKLAVKDDEKILSKVEYKTNKKDIALDKHETQNAQLAEIEDDEVFSDTKTVNISKNESLVSKLKLLIKSTRVETL